MRGAVAGHLARALGTVRGPTLSPRPRSRFEVDWSDGDKPSGPTTLGDVDHGEPAREIAPDRRARPLGAPSAGRPPTARVATTAGPEPRPVGASRPSAWETEGPARPATDGHRHDAGANPPTRLPAGGATPDVRGPDASSTTGLPGRARPVEPAGATRPAERSTDAADVEHPLAAASEPSTRGTLLGRSGDRAPPAGDLPPDSQSVPAAPAPPSPTPSAAPDIVIRIGRIDIRGPSSGAVKPAAPRAADRHRSRRSLDDWLRAGGDRS